MKLSWRGGRVKGNGSIFGGRRTTQLMRDSLGIHGGTVIERVVLFVLAMLAVFLVNAGLHDLSHARGGWPYFLGGVFIVVLLVRSWSRLAASLRKDRAERSVGGPDA